MLTRLLLACAIASLLLLPSAPRPAAGPPARPADSALVLPGLEQPVLVLTDRWGVPHIRATNERDLYFAWGFVSARDRLWQMLAMRQAVRGRLWQWSGNRTLQADGGAQLFELDGLADRIWARARRDPAAAVPLERYSAGVNAWLALCRRGTVPWPVEIERLRWRPDDWAPADAPAMLLAMGSLLDLAFPQFDERREIGERGVAGYERRVRFERSWDYTTIPRAVTLEQASGAGGTADPRAAGAALPPRLVAPQSARWARSAAARNATSTCARAMSSPSVHAAARAVARCLPTTCTCHWWPRTPCTWFTSPCRAWWTRPARACPDCQPS